MSEQAKPTLAEFGKLFQERIIQALLNDHVWAQQMVEVFDVDYFELRYLNFLASRFFAYGKKYKAFPTWQLLVTIIRDELKTGTDIVLRDQIIDFLKRIRTNPDPGDLPYVREKALDFARKQALKAALEAAVDQIQAEKYEQIVEGIKKAVCVGTTPVLGHDFFVDYEARFRSMQRDCIPFGLDELDRKEVLNGGLGKGELSCIVASTGVGKSHILVMIGANAMRHGKNVLHYTMELSEEKIGIRYDSNLCDIDASDVVENKETVLAAYNDNKLGRLMIKAFPSSSATIYTIRAHVERLELNGFRPDLIIIDYADVMRSTRQYDSPRHELKLIYEELRGYAVEKNLPILTASQSNREGSDSDIIDLKNMSEAFGKAMICDFVLSLSRKPLEKSSGMGRIFVCKNRAGIDGIIYPVKLNTARSRLEITGPEGSLGETIDDDEKDMKRAIREKWNELKADGIIVDRIAS